MLALPLAVPGFDSQPIHMSEYRKVWEEFKTRIWEEHHKTEPDWKTMAIERQKTLTVLGWSFFLCVLSVVVAIPLNCLSVFFMLYFFALAMKSTIRIWQDKHNFTESYRK